MLWSLLILSLPASHSTARMRAWRALKAAGAAVLRDGVYLLPATAAGATLQAVAEDVRQHQGQAHLMQTEAPEAEHAALFDRSADYAPLLADASAALQALPASAAALPEAERALRRLHKGLDAVAATDFFPGEARRQTEAAVARLGHALAETQARLSGAAEPLALADQALPRLALAEFQGRCWATRARPWVDRLACGWLIRRFIDPQAQFLWLARPQDCPADALGFDFDGARFSHVGARVSFETLLASFGLEDQPALQRLGLLVHALDAGGIRPAEASGVERVLAGMRAAIADDDLLLQVAAGVFEGLWASYQQEQQA